MLLSRPARGLAVARDGPRCTNMYETRNETTNLARMLMVVVLGRPLGQRTDGIQSRPVCGFCPRIKRSTWVCSGESQRGCPPGRQRDPYVSEPARTAANCN